MVKIYHLKVLDYNMEIFFQNRIGTSDMVEKGASLTLGLNLKNKILKMKNC